MRWKIHHRLTVTLLLLLMVGCHVPVAATPTIDLFATLQASTPSGVALPVETERASTPNFAFATAAATSLSASVASPSASASQLSGKIVFTCQVNRAQASDQICIINADGTGFRQLTNDNVRHFYPSLSPDGKSVLYVAFRETNVYEIYEMNLSDGTIKRLTNRIGVLTAPEISPDGETITF
ncbi:MAG TPA: hypothetical protein PLM89_06025, partial [Anaerolineales bacterium]|nr:hypothetical protein [Anaerolineales bacterium]